MNREFTLPNKYKVLRHEQLEDTLQNVILNVTKGKPSYTKTDVLRLIRAIYNECIRFENMNASIGLYIREVEYDFFVKPSNRNRDNN